MVWKLLGNLTVFGTKVKETAASDGNRNAENAENSPE